MLFETITELENDEYFITSKRKNNERYIFKNTSFGFNTHFKLLITISRFNKRNILYSNINLSRVNEIVL